MTLKTRLIIFIVIIGLIHPFGVTILCNLDNVIAKPLEISLVEANGKVVAIEGNIAAAKEGAIKEAMRNAVEQVVKGILDPKDVINNYDLLNNIFYTKGEDFIRTYKVLSESFDPAVNQYSVSIYASLFLGALKNELISNGLSIKEDKISRHALILIKNNRLMADNSPSDFFIVPVVEKILSDSFKDNGIAVTDRYGIRDCGGEQLMQAVLNGDESAARVIGGKCVVDVVVIGTEETKVKDIDKNIYIVAANISAKVIMVSNGKVIAISTESFTATGDGYMYPARKAIREAGTKLAESLIQQVADNSNIE